jgi:hypothetical protein
MNAEMSASATYDSARQAVGWGDAEPGQTGEGDRRPRERERPEARHERQPQVRGQELQLATIISSPYRASTRTTVSTPCPSITNTA